jgi:hypothetical protein
MTLKILMASVAAAGAMVMLGSGASAAVLYSNPYNATADDGACEWSTTCAASTLYGDDFAAQEFALSSSDILTSATFTELDFGTTPTPINWAIYDANGSGGLPGALVTSGSSVVTSTSSLGSDASGQYDVTTGTFSLPSVDLTSGSYYLAIQGVSSSFYNFLAEGTSSSGAAETIDGGLTFTSGYGQTPSLASVAVSISGTPVSAAPEPSTWALMILGLGLVGSTLRLGRRQGKTAAA